MKSSVFISGLLIASLTQGVAHGQVFDLPEPGDETSMNPSVASLETADSQFAGSLRLGMMSRKEEGTPYRLLLAPSVRLERMDLRVAFGKARVREAWLVTESGQRIEISQYRATGVLDASTLYRSENFSLNENVSEVQLLIEAFSNDAELIVTAVSENVLPRLTLWKAPAAAVSNSLSRNTFISPTRGGQCVEDFCVGDVVIYMRYRAMLVEVRGNGRAVILQRGVRKTVKTSQLLPLSGTP